MSKLQLQVRRVADRVLVLRIELPAHVTRSHNVRDQLAHRLDHRLELATLRLRDTRLQELDHPAPSAVRGAMDLPHLLLRQLQRTRDIRLTTQTEVLGRLLQITEH